MAPQQFKRPVTYRRHETAIEATQSPSNLETKSPGETGDYSFLARKLPTLEPIDATVHVSSRQSRCASTQRCV
jgi:hypothetical protein